jgi:type I restriction enzyme M protein
VLGAQGDAGQFRTPRHLIDFLVEVLDPQKNESILDPACGTAGFLISAYKHILKANGKQRPGDQLTPDQRARLVSNIKGYDISPDMVRLSLANLYLHGFPNPTVEEYDTLTSEAHWADTFDVILANPPFMSPKGGIRPHKRFSMSSSRSEVLFVDYIAEHLSPQGRAAIIVPEGIIFQSGTSHRALRKLLVKQSLVAVVSLPAGVFNPYSGVKTSVLILDKRLAQHTDEVLFVKIVNDGYNLGAQRRETIGSELPAAANQLRTWFKHLRKGGLNFSTPDLDGLHRVAKSRIGENADWNLSGERYRDEHTQATEYKMVALGEVCSFMTGGTPTSTVTAYYEGGTIPWLVSGDIHKQIIYDCEKRITEAALASSNARILPQDSVLIALNGQGKTRGTVALLKMNNATCNQSLVSIAPKNSEQLLAAYLYSVMQAMYRQIRNLTGDDQRSGLNIPILKAIKIPLPPLTVQQEIVAEIAGYQRVLDGARQVLTAYKPHVTVDATWPLVELGKVFKTRSGTTPRRDQDAYFVSGTIPWVKTLDLNDAQIWQTEESITELALQETSLQILPKGTVLVAMYGGFNQIGRTGVLEIEATHNQAMTALLPNDSVDPYFLNYSLVGSREYWKKVANSTRKDANITKTDVLQFKLALPDLTTQRAIVAEIEAEQRLVAANQELIERMEARIRAAISRVWGSAASIKAPVVEELAVEA